MTKPKLVTLDEYVCEHWGLTSKQMQGIDICGFNQGDTQLPLDMDQVRQGGISYGDGSFGIWPEGHTPSRGPIIHFSTMPLDRYMAGMYPCWMQERLDWNDGWAKRIGYAINVLVPKAGFHKDVFEDVCEALRGKLPITIGMDQATKTGNDKVFYGRAGCEGGNFRCRDLTATIPSEQAESGGKVQQYTPRYQHQRHRLGWMYPNQIQIRWKGTPESTIRLVEGVAALVKERQYEAHFDLRIDRNGLMRKGFGITGVFYKP